MAGLDRLTQALVRFGEALAQASVVWRHQLIPAFRRAAAEDLEEAAWRGDPFARRRLAHVGHPRWAPEMAARARAR